MKIGDEVYVHGYVDEIRKGTYVDIVIIRNKGGYFGTDASEVILADRKTESDSEKPNNCETCANGEGDIEACGYCRHGDLYEPKTEPQTEEIVSCQMCKHWIPHECTNDKCHYEPKAEKLYDQVVEDINTRVKCAFAKKVEDEPQTETSTNSEKVQLTDCAWGKSDEDY